MDTVILVSCLGAQKGQAGCENQNFLSSSASPLFLPAPQANCTNVSSRKQHLRADDQISWREGTFLLLQK